MRYTRFERSWLRISLTLSFVLVAIFFLRPILPSVHVENGEPLADPLVLKELQSGLPVPKPTDVTKGEFHGLPVTPPLLASLETEQKVLGTGVSADEKRIEVDLTHQKVYAFEGSRKVYEFVVSTGKWARTPTGEFRIWAKLKSTRMSGGNPAIGTYYNLPNVPWVMFFGGGDVANSRGFSLHGTYWHNNFGHPMSHGCVNMKIPDSQTLFEWANPTITNPKAWSTNATSDNPGTKVVIYGEAPKE